jgi:hypothetical protein
MRTSSIRKSSPTIIATRFVQLIISPRHIRLGERCKD